MLYELQMPDRQLVVVDQATGTRRRLGADRTGSPVPVHDVTVVVGSPLRVEWRESAPAAPRAGILVRAWEVARRAQLRPGDLALVDTCDGDVLTGQVTANGRQVIRLMVEGAGWRELSHATRAVLYRPVPATVVADRARTGMIGGRR